MRHRTCTHNTLTTPALGSATAVVQVGRWALPVVCVLVFSTALAFAAEQAIFTDRGIATSADAQVSSENSFSGVSPTFGDDPQRCPITVAQADIDFYLLAIS